jgi:hypothetical protein
MQMTVYSRPRTCVAGMCVGHRIVRPVDLQGFWEPGVRVWTVFVPCAAVGCKIGTAVLPEVELSACNIQ